DETDSRRRGARIRGRTSAEGGGLPPPTHLAGILVGSDLGRRPPPGRQPADAGGWGGPGGWPEPPPGVRQDRTEPATVGRDRVVGPIRAGSWPDAVASTQQIAAGVTAVAVKDRKSV